MATQECASPSAINLATAICVEHKCKRLLQTIQTLPRRARAGDVAGGPCCETANRTTIIQTGVGVGFLGGNPRAHTQMWVVQIRPRHQPESPKHL